MHRCLHSDSSVVSRQTAGFQAWGTEVFTNGEAWNRWEKCEGKRGRDECPGARGDGEGGVQHPLSGEREHKPPQVLSSFKVI